MDRSCVGDNAYIKAASGAAESIMTNTMIEIAIDAALALWKRNSSSAIADMQYEISKRQLKLAQDIRDHAKKFWPYEEALVKEVFGEPKAEAQYGPLSTTWGSFTDVSFNKGQNALSNELSRRCITASKCELQRFNRYQQLSRADMISFADRQAEARKENLNDSRFNKQYAVLGLGRGLLGDIPSYQQIAGAYGNSARTMLMGTLRNGRELYNALTQWKYQIREDYAYEPYAYDKSKISEILTEGIRLDSNNKGHVGGVGFKYDLSKL